MPGVIEDTILFLFNLKTGRFTQREILRTIHSTKHVGRREGAVRHPALQPSRGQVERQCWLLRSVVLQLEVTTTRVTRLQRPEEQGLQQRSERQCAKVATGKSSRARVISRAHLTRSARSWMLSSGKM